MNPLTAMFCIAGAIFLGFIVKICWEDYKNDRRR